MQVPHRHRTEIIWVLTTKALLVWKIMLESVLTPLLNFSKLQMVWKSPPHGTGASDISALSSQIVRHILQRL